jgi:hypothetical protein
VPHNPVCDWRSFMVGSERLCCYALIASIKPATRMKSKIAKHPVRKEKKE